MSRHGLKALDIAIVGGGITGLVCAAALAKEGVEADMYEAKVSLLALRQEYFAVETNLRVPVVQVWRNWCRSWDRYASSIHLVTEVELKRMQVPMLSESWRISA